MKRQVLLGLALLSAVAIALGGAYIHSRAHLQALQSQAAYPSPEEGMRAFVADSYTGLQKVEIVHAGQDLPLLPKLWFVEAWVWADRRADGKAVKTEGDNPGCFFLRLEEGWVLVPESRCPELLALGMRLFG